MERQVTQNSDGANVDADAESGGVTMAPSPPLPPLPPPPGRAQNQNMYIVQFPKDQIYRVPPRENALIVEKYRNPQPKVKRRRCPCDCTPRLMLTIALVIVSIIAILGITFAVLYFIFRPTGPTFTVTNLVVKRNSKNAPPQYEVSLRAKNPNRRLGLEYNENDDVSLMFGNTKVARGKFPTLKQGQSASTEDVKVELAGSSGPLPKEMERSMNDAKSITPVEFELDMKLGVKIIAARVKSWVMKSNVDCKFKVRGLGNDTSILSQQCETYLKRY